MNKITGVTRRDIFDLFKKGITEDNWLITENIFYPYYGRSDVVEFLKRLYNLADWESRDSRVENAEEEIIMHTHNGETIGYSKTKDFSCLMVKIIFC